MTIQKAQLCALVRKANVMRPVCALLLGKHHKPSHRMIAGVITMAVGIAIYKAGEHFDSHAVAFITDAVGFFIHGMGLTPFLEHIAEEVADV